MLMPLSGFDWDSGNREKCQKHGVTIGEIEALFSETLAVQPDPMHSGVEERFQAIGRGILNRYIFLVFTIRERRRKQYIRVISARYMHRKEIRRYEKDHSSAGER
jgi:uncharacterized protein